MYLAYFAQTVKPCLFCGGRGCSLCNRTGVLVKKHQIISDKPLTNREVEVCRVNAYKEVHAVRVEESNNEQKNITK